MRFRSALYWTARRMGDVNALARGKLPQRLIRSYVLRKVNGAVQRILPK